MPEENFVTCESKCLIVRVIFLFANRVKGKPLKLNRRI